MEENTGNKTIAVNTVFLYIRMFCTMAIGIFSSRFILQNLGVEDYGIYNVVGGIVMMFAFINTTMSGATSRFINYELGKKSGKMKNVFSTALTVHVIIALIVVFIGETFGYWFLTHKLVIPAERMYAAQWLLQFSIVSVFFNFTQVPFNACLIAYERMKAFAYFGLGSSIVNLIVVILLVYSPWDRMIVYGFISMTISVSITLIYRAYCIRNFHECTLRLSIDKEFLRPMMSYSIWDIFGQGSAVIKTQGVNMVLNMFFGPIVNAATAVATTVQTQVLSFSTNVMFAFSPQIIKKCAQEDYKRMEELIHFGAKCSFLLFLLVSVPLIVNIDLILGTWLKDVPENATIFCQFALLSSLFSAFSSYPMIGIDATGRIRDTSIIYGIIGTMVVPVSYVMFKLDFLNPFIPYIYNCSTPLLSVFINSYFLHRYIPEFSQKSFLKKCLTPSAFICLSAILLSKATTLLFSGKIVVFFISSIVSTFYIAFIGIIVCFDKAQRIQIIRIIKQKILRRP